MKNPIFYLYCITHSIDLSPHLEVGRSNLSITGGKTWRIFAKLCAMITLYKGYMPNYFDEIQALSGMIDNLKMIVLLRFQRGKTEQMCLHIPGDSCYNKRMKMNWCFMT